MSAQRIDEKAIFNIARRIDSRDARADYLQQVCGADADARKRVVELLQVHEQEQSFLESPAVEVSPTIDRPLERPGTQIGPYKLLEQIGEGGMGVVYMAEQTEPITRRVALKVIKPGMDTRQVIARFEAERQALAMMDHVNIARILDAGIVGQAFQPDSQAGKPDLRFGRPYFVMELVKGIPITKYCDELHLTLSERLALFIPVCQAIQHAHQKGIIHRDIKPTNVLVALYDGVPVPKVIDFGVAKATGQKVTEKTMFTGFGQLIGTLDYMSPEQAQFNQLDIDTRSDVYSLGVLLYELLTGTTPFEQSRRDTVALDETLRIIREEEPPKPSTRLSTASMLPTIAANRSVEPAQLRRQVRGELDWIVMKALAKDRNRRYESASGLAADIQRFLHHDPVQACPPSAAYRLQKFVRRNRTGVLVTGLALLSLLMLVGGGAWLGRERARRQTRLNQEVAATVQEAALSREQALNLTDAPRQWEATLAMASSALKRAKALVAEDAELLEPPLPLQVHDLAARLEADEKDRRLVSEIERIRLEKSEPDIEHSHFTNAESVPKYRELFASYGLTATTTPTQEAAAWIAGKHRAIRDALIAGLDDWLDYESGRQERAWLNAVLAQADSDAWRNQVREARRRGDVAALEALAERPEALSQPPATLVMLGTALSTRKSHDAAVRMLRRAQQRYPSDFWINDSLARSFEVQQPPQWAEALTFYRIAVALRPESAGAYMNLGKLLTKTGDLPGAIAGYSEATELQPRYAAAHYWLGDVLRIKGDQPEAIGALQKALEIRPQYAEAHNLLGAVLCAMGDLPGAITACQKAIAIKPDLAYAHYVLGLALQQQGDRPGAIAAYERAIELQPNYASAHYNRGVLLQEQGDQPGAIAAYEKAITSKPDHAEAHTNLSSLLRAQGDLPGEIVELRKAIEIMPELAVAHCNLGRALRDQGAFREALPALQRGHKLGSKRANWTYPSARWIEDCQRLVELDDQLPAILDGQEQPADANECIELARVCTLKRLYRAAARLYQQAFAEQPELARWQYRFPAARAAALAGCGQGKDAAELDDAELARWRQQALDWLRSALLDWSNLEDKTPEFRSAVRKAVEDLQRHADLARFRDEEFLAQLPDVQRATWQQLWNEAEAVRADAAKSRP